MANYLENAAKKSLTVPGLKEFKERGEKIATLTCYDASFASLMSRLGVDILLVGDSLGMVCQGHSSTLPVTIADMAYHTASVARGNTHSLVITDMPFGSYATPECAMHHAVTLIQAGAHMVKLEGGAWLASTVQFLTERSIPVCAHIGLTPQSVHKMGGYKVQGKSRDAAQSLQNDAQTLEAAGAEIIVLEGVPKEVGREITQSLRIPTIGIGAGPDCSGQVLVMHDFLGVFPGKKAKFVRNFMENQTTVEGAITAYIAAVKDGSFPGPEHCF